MSTTPKPYWKRESTNQTFPFASRIRDEIAEWNKIRETRNLTAEEKRQYDAVLTARHFYGM